MRRWTSFLFGFTEQNAFGTTATLTSEGREMPKVVMTCKVKDAAKWEQEFRTHGQLFRRQTVTKPIGIAIHEDNTVAICVEPTDLGIFMEILESESTAQAMKNDGVERDTVQIYVMDREFQP